MSWRNLVIISPVALSYKNGQLLCKPEGQEEFSIPLEDIATVTLETAQIKITATLLSEIADRGIALITCDSKHIPNGVLLPLSAHSRQLKILNQQLEWGASFKKRLWQKIICQKIKNQHSVLSEAGCSNSKLITLANLVESGDKKNVEGQAAKFYFSRLFKNFKRHADDKPNAALNYGYAVVRAAIARELAQFGFHPALGVHHCNELNAFNLADDMLEPFRPLIDGWVLKNIDFNGSHRLSSQERGVITQVLQIACSIGEKEHRLLHAIHLSVKSLSSASGNKNYRLLLLPEWNGSPRLKSLE